MLGTPKKMWRKLSRLRDLLHLRAGIGDGDEAVADFLVADLLATRSKKYCLKMLGSSVLPDLLETMKRVFCRSSFASKRFDLRGIGGIEHVQLGEALDLAEGEAQDFGQRLEPPMPSSRACLNSAFLMSAAMFFSVDRCAPSWSSVMPSQPSHLPSSRWSKARRRAPRGARLCRSFSSRRSTPWTAPESSAGSL